MTRRTLANTLGGVTSYGREHAAAEPTVWDSCPLLCQLAAEEGLTRQADIAELAELKPSLVSRLWSDPLWIEKIGADRLIALARVLPTLMTYLSAQPTSLLRRAEQQLATHGITINHTAVRALVDDAGVHPSHVAAALRAGARLIECDDDGELLDTCGLVALFWERNRGACFERLVSADPAMALLGPDTTVLDRARRLLHLLVDRRPSKGPVVKIDRARQVLIHYLALDEPGAFTPVDNARDHTTALDVRCGFTSAVIRDDDLDLVRWYKRRIDADPLTRLIEAWMFPAWTGDLPANSFPARPGQVLLVRTGREIAREVLDPRYGGAYLYYLIAVYLPLALSTDRTLGDRIGDVGAMIDRRLDTVGPSSPLQEAAAQLRTLTP